jgi:hypothetical protein
MPEAQIDLEQAMLFLGAGGQMPLMIKGTDE